MDSVRASGVLLGRPVRAGIRDPGRLRSRCGGDDDRPVGRLPAPASTDPARSPEPAVYEPGRGRSGPRSSAGCRNAYVLTGGAGVGCSPSRSSCWRSGRTGRSKSEIAATSRPACRRGSRARRGGAGLRPGGLRELPLAARPVHRRRRAAVRPASQAWESRRDPRRCGARGGSARTWPARPAGSRATGNWPTSGTRGTSSPIRSCPATRGCSTARPEIARPEALDLVAYLDSLGKAARLAGAGTPSSRPLADPELDEWCAQWAIRARSRRQPDPPRCFRLPPT